MVDLRYHNQVKPAPFKWAIDGIEATAIGISSTRVGGAALAQPVLPIRGVARMKEIPFAWAGSVEPAYEVASKMSGLSYTPGHFPGFAMPLQPDLMVVTIIPWCGRK